MLDKQCVSVQRSGGDSRPESSPLPYSLAGDRTSNIAHAHFFIYYTKGKLIADAYSRPLFAAPFSTFSAGFHHPSL
jgi:hypothetical protein